MGVVLPRRAIYRLWQFMQVLLAPLAWLNEPEKLDVRACLPEAAWPLFDAMPLVDQRHSFNVMQTLRRRGQTEPTLLEAALLHDCAKREGRVSLWHRVLMVFLKALWPATIKSLGGAPEPAHSHWTYPLWAHANHPARGAQLAAGTGCSPLGVWLIEHHQDGLTGPSGDHRGALLAALQVADDNN